MLSSSRTWTVPFALLNLALMIGAWILFVAGTKLHEMIVGAGALIASTLFLNAIRKSSGLELEFRVADLAACWRLPWYVLSDAILIVGIMFRDLFTSYRAESLYRVSGFVTAKKDPLLVARRVLATVYTTTSPNSIIIGIDFAQSRMLFHQLRRAPVSEMTRRLGARP